VAKPLRKLLLGRPGRRWKDNIKIYLRKMDFYDGSWMDLAENRVSDRFS
jgi:hypothetical protein